MILSYCYLMLGNSITILLSSDIGQMKTPKDMIESLDA